MVQPLSRALSILAVSTGTTLLTTSLLPANAAVLFFTSREEFLTQATNLSTIDFEGIAAPGSFNYYPSPEGVTLSGVTFTDDTSNFQFIVDSAYVSPENNPYSFMGSAFLSAPAGNNYPQPGTPASSTNVKFSPEAGSITALGADIAALFLDRDYSTATSFTIDVLGESFTFAPGLGQIGFIGVLSTDPITSLAITSSDSDRSGPQLDNFTFGQAQPRSQQCN